MKVSVHNWFFAAFFTVSLLVAGSTFAEEKQQNRSHKIFAVQQPKAESKGDSTGNPAKGKEVFEANCLFCHNADSDEALVGPGLKNLFKWPPHKLSDGTEHAEHTVATIRKQIVEGGGGMAPMGDSLSKQELDDLIAYLQTL